MLNDISVICSVDVFNFLQPVLENNVNNDMSVAKIVEACRQEVSHNSLFTSISLYFSAPYAISNIF